MTIRSFPLPTLMANQPGANVGTDILDKLCKYFGRQPGDLLTYVPDDALEGKGS